MSASGIRAMKTASFKNSVKPLWVRDIEVEFMRPGAPPSNPQTGR